jgi:hypothetical protein
MSNSVRGFLWRIALIVLVAAATRCAWAQQGLPSIYVPRDTVLHVGDHYQTIGYIVPYNHMDCKIRNVTVTLDPGSPFDLHYGEVMFDPYSAGMFRDTALVYVEYQASRICAAPSGYQYAYLFVAAISNNRVFVQGGLPIFSYNDSVKAYVSTADVRLYNDVAHATAIRRVTIRTQPDVPIDYQIFDSNHVALTSEIFAANTMQKLTLRISSSTYKSFDYIIISAALNTSGTDSLSLDTLYAPWGNEASVSQPTRSDTHLDALDPTDLRLVLGTGERMTLSIYRVTGERVYSTEGYFTEGTQSIKLKERLLPGCYFYELRSATSRRVGKLALLE